MSTDSKCCIHGDEESFQKVRELRYQHEDAVLRAKTMRVEALTWLRRYRHAKKRLAQSSQRLRDAGVIL